jgi:hypothetical protein
MTLWNFLYLALAVVVFYAMAPAALKMAGLCLVPVALLWAWRWLADRSRSSARREVLANSRYTEVTDRRPLSALLSSFAPPVRDWIMRGYPTGLTQYWVRDAWRARHAGMDFTAFELQTTPGYMGTGIPLWRVRHGALLVTGPQAGDCLASLGPALGLAPGRDQFTLAQEGQLVIVWRKHPPDGERIKWLLDRSTAGVPGLPGGG